MWIIGQMFLMDAIVDTAATAARAGFADNIAISEYTRLAGLLNPIVPGKKQGSPSRLRGPIPPRFIFDRQAIQVATEVTLGRPKVQREVMKHLRVPYSGMWVEWEDAHREELRRRFRQDERLDDIKPYPTRMGFFIEADETGRRGRITWAWSTKRTRGGKADAYDKVFDPERSGAFDSIPNVAAIWTEFDLDGDFQLPDFEKYPLSLANVWEGNQIQLDALYSIWRTATHVETPSAQLIHRGDEFARAVLYSDVVGEYIVVWAILFLLTASRKAVDYREVDMSRLNKARQKSKKTELLDHKVVHLYIGEDTARPKVLRGPLEYKRKTPHFHEVSSYIGHRGDKHWLILPYWRGSGVPVRKTVFVHG